MKCLSPLCVKKLIIDKNVLRFHGKRPYVFSNSTLRFGKNDLTFLNKPIYIFNWRFNAFVTGKNRSYRKSVFNRKICEEGTKKSKIIIFLNDYCTFYLIKFILLCTKYGTLNSLDYFKIQAFEIQNNTSIIYSKLISIQYL